MNGHLYTRLSARTLKNDIKPIHRTKLLEGTEHIVLCPPHRLLGGFRLFSHGQTMHLTGEPVLFGEIETGLVDIDGDDARSAVGFGQCAGEEPYGAYAEDEGGLTLLEICASGCVEEDGERFGESSLFK